MLCTRNALSFVRANPHEGRRDSKANTRNPLVLGLTYARKKIQNTNVYAALGGFHLFALNDEKLDWTASKLKEFGLQQFLGAHCTGIEAVYRIRQQVGLTRQNCVVGAVGASFDLGKGIDPTALAR